MSSGRRKHQPSESNDQVPFIMTVDILQNVSLCSLNNILAPQWRKDKSIEKNVAHEWKKLTGTNEINAKYRYVQFCRSLKTYGVTLFQVKVRLPPFHGMYIFVMLSLQEKPKGGKKFVPKLLGFTRDSIMR